MPNGTMTPRAIQIPAPTVLHPQHHLGPQRAELQLPTRDQITKISISTIEVEASFKLEV